MTLTRLNLVERVREAVPVKRKKKDKQQYLFPELDREFMSKKCAAELINSMFEIIKATLEKGESVLITGFGKFHVKFRWARKARNPRTGKQIIVNSRRIVAFKYSNVLRKKLNSVKEDNQ